MQFKVGVPRTEALVRLYDTVSANADWLPGKLGALPPIINLTLFSKTNGEIGTADLERVAHSMEIELKRMPGTREVTSIGGPGRGVIVELDAGRMASVGLSVADLRRASQSANAGAPLGDLLRANQAIALEVGSFLRSFTLLSLALGVPGSLIFHSSWWLAFTAFVGVNLLQSGVTRWCLMESILAKLGVRRGS